MIKKILSFILFIASFSFNTVISQIIGGQIRASLISSNKIEVQASVYRDCRGLAISSKNFTYGCYVGKNGDNSCGSITLTPPSFKTKNIDYLYKGQTPPCNPSNTYGTGMGIEMHTFTDTVDLSSSGISSLLSSGSCNEINFYIQKCCRNAAYSNGSQSTVFTLSTTIYLSNLSRCIKKTNNAPEIAFAPKLKITDQELHVYTPAPYDIIDNDKIICKLDAVLSDVPNKTVTLSSPYKTNAPIPTYCGPSGSGFCSPVPSLSPAKGFYFDTVEGLMIFQPNIVNTLGTNAFSNAAIHIFEYRLDSIQKWILISRSMREFELIHLNTGGNNNPPVINSNKNVLAIAGKPFYYEFKITDNIKSGKQSSADTLQVNVVSGCKAFNIYVKNPKDREKTVVIEGTPDSSYISKVPYRMSVLCNDQFGQYLSISSRQIMIHIKPQGGYKAQSLEGLCNRIILKAAVDKSIPGTTEYTWTIIDATTGKLQFSTKNAFDSSLSLTNGKKYIKLIMVNENYAFATFYDTIELQNAPTFSVSGDTTICKGTKLDITCIPVKMKSITQVEYIVGSDYSYIDSVNHFNKLNIDSSIKMTAIATDISGCQATTVISIKALNLPNKQFTTPVKICQNGPDLDLLGYCNLSKTDTIKIWSYQGLVYSDRFFATKNVSKAEFISSSLVRKMIYYSISDSNNCILKDSTEISINRLPYTTLMQNDLCQNQLSKDLNKLILIPSSNSLTQNKYRWKVIDRPILSKNQQILSKGIDTIEHYFSFGNKVDTIYGGTYKFQFYYLDLTTQCEKYDTLKLIVYNEPKITFQIDPFYCSNQKNIDLLSLVRNNNEPAVFGNFELLSHNNSNTSGIFYGTRLISNRYFPKNAVEGIWKFSFIDPLARCKDTGYAEFKIVPTPESDFRTKDTLIDELTPTILAINNSSISDNSTLEYLWDPGTLKPSDMATTKDFNFTYPNNSGIYNLKLVASNYVYGCSDTFKKTIKVQKNVGISELNRNGYTLNNDCILSKFDGQFLSGKWYNESGQLIWEDKQNSGISLKPGIYFYEISIIKSTEVQNIKGKFFKQ